jgi:hypothetical protein
MSRLLPEYLSGPSDRQTSFHYLTRTWEISCDSIVMTLIDGPDRKLKGGKRKQKSAG